MEETTSKFMVDELDVQCAELIDRISEAETAWHALEMEKVESSVPERTVKELAAECAGLLRLKADVNKQRERLFQRCLPFMQDAFAGVWVDEEAFRRSKHFLDILNAKTGVLAGRIEAVKKLGHEARESEAEALTREALETERWLIDERRAAVREKLIPLKAELVVIAESLSDGDIHLDREERSLLNAEIERRRRRVNPEKTIAGRLKDLKYRLDTLKEKSYPTFNHLVERRLEVQEGERWIS